MPTRKPAKTSKTLAAKPKTARKTVKAGPYRLTEVNELALNPAQHKLLESLRASPRGKGVSLGGPFGVYMHAPEVGEVAQQLAAFCRYHTRLPKRLSEFAILYVGRQWLSQYEFFVNARDGAAAGLAPGTIRDLQAGRAPKKAPKDERALYAFLTELHRKKRVSDKAYKAVHAILGDAGMIELIAIVGSYTTTSMILNAFRVPLPEGAVPPFAEPKV
jgi:4-carboxymuconolactone decarboxylase